MHALYRLRQNRPIGQQRTTRRTGRILFQKVITAPAPAKVVSLKLLDLKRLKGYLCCFNLRQRRHWRDIH